MRILEVPYEYHAEASTNALVERIWDTTPRKEGSTMEARALIAWILWAITRLVGGI